MAFLTELRAKFTATVDGFRNAVDDVNRDLNNMGNQSGNSADTANQKFGSLKSTLLGFAGAYVGFEVITGAVSNIATATMDLEESLTRLQNQTGATDKEMQGLEQTVKNIYGANLGEDFNDVADSLASVKTATGLTGDELEKATKNALILRDTYDYDVSESIRTADILSQQFGISHEEAMNMIVSGAQDGLDMHDDMLATFQEYPVYFKQMGFSADEFYSILASGSENGAFNLDYVADAMKEFGIRAKDGSKTTVEALESLGLNADEIMGKFAKGGTDAREAFSTVTKALGGVDDQMKLNELGVALFGTKYEDLEKDAVQAMANMTSETKINKDALEEVNKVKFESLGQAFGSIGRQIQLAIIDPVQKHVLPALATFVEWLMANMPQISAVISAVFGTLFGIFGTLATVIGAVATPIMTVLSHLMAWEGFVPIITGIVTAIGTYLAVTKAVAVATTLWSNVTKIMTATQTALNLVMSLNPIGVVVALIVGLIAVIVMAYKNSETFRDILNGVWESVKAGFQAFLNFFTETLPAWVESIGGWFKNVGTAISDAFTGAFDWVKTKWEEFKSFCSTAVETLFIFFTTFIPQKLEEVKDKIMSFTMGIEDTLAGWRDNSTGIIKVLFDFFHDTVYNITNTIMGIFHVFIGLFTGDTEKMKEGLSQIWTAWKDQIINIVTTFKDMAIGIFNAFKTTLTNIFNGIKTTVINIWNGIKTGITNIINNVKNTVSTIVNTIKNTISNAFNTAKTTVINAVQGLYNGVVSWFNNVLTKANNLKNDIINKFKSINLVEVGKDIIRGLWNGIGNMAGWVKDKIQGLAGNVVGWAKSALGIKSPSRVFMEIGNFVGEGMAIGIDQQEDNARKSAENMAGAVIDGGTPSGNAVASGGNGLFDFDSLLTGLATLINGSVPLVAVENMTVRNDQDIQKISRDLKALIDQSRRSRGIK